jgi:YgiT-type zinc finger domain-containing protein
MKNCSVRSCPGKYEERRIAHVVKHRGEVIVFDNVPVEVCSVCGDVLMSLDTAEAMEAVLANLGKPTRSAPVYELSNFKAA